MTVAASDGPGPPPPVAAPALPRSEDTFRGMDTVFTAAPLMRVVLIMNAAFHVCAAIFVFSAAFEHAPGSPAEWVEALGMGGVGVVLALVNAAAVYGTVQMENLKRRPWAIVAVVCSLVPCASPCCLFSVPLGIWALTGMRRVPYDAWE